MRERVIGEQTIRGFMSIKLAARKYLEKMGIPGDWVSEQYLPKDRKNKFAIVVVEGFKNEFNMQIMHYDYEFGWCVPTNEGWRTTKQTIVCWSEVKI